MTGRYVNNPMPTYESRIISLGKIGSASTVNSYQFDIIAAEYMTTGNPPITETINLFASDDINNWSAIQASAYG